MKNKLQEIKLRSINYKDDQAKADVTILINIVEHLLQETTIQYTAQHRPLVCPGIELRYKENRWQSVLNLGDWIGNSNEDFIGEICSKYTDIESAVKTAIELRGQLGLILPLENKKPLLFHDKSVPEELQERVKTMAVKFGFRTE